jgi:putative transposase
MSRNYYCEIHLHLVWHTKTSLPLLEERVETAAFAAIRDKAAGLGGIYIHELGATPTHMHAACSIEPSVTVSEMIGTLKGFSSHEANQRLGFGRKILEWQAGYGVVSFGTKDLPWVCEYVRNQKEHHGVGTIHRRLEIITVEEDG